MAVQKLTLKSETNMFGTTLKMFNKSKSKSWTLAENLEFDPLAKNKKKLENGYLFRFPNADMDNVEAAINHLDRLDGAYSFWFNKGLEKDSINGYIRIETASDAQYFAFSHVTYWQKWSDALEAQEIADHEKEKNSESKVTVHEDGRITIEAEVDVLGD